MDTGVTTITKYGGWSIKELAGILDYQSPKKVPSGMDPWLRKAAALWDASPERFLSMVLCAVRESRLPVLTPAELATRERIQTGRLDRSVLHPQAS